MYVTDPIADLLTRVRNAIQAKHDIVEIPASKEKVEIVRILKEEGFIRDYLLTGEGIKKSITVVLKYGPNGERVISGLKRISKPGKRVYVKAEATPRVLNGLGIAIITTSNGMLTDKQARAKHVGGEVLAYVW